VAFAARRTRREPVELPEQIRSLRHVESFRTPAGGREMRRTGGLSPSYAGLGQHSQSISRSAELHCSARGGMALSLPPVSPLVETETHRRRLRRAEKEAKADKVLQKQSWGRAANDAHALGAALS
jgi:hypothetical protein